MDESKNLDYRLTEVGRQNWEVCARMLVHDLLDIAPKNPDVKRLLDFYSIGYTSNGNYTMALPRLKVLDCKNRQPKVSKGKKKAKKK